MTPKEPTHYHSQLDQEVMYELEQAASEVVTAKLDKSNSEVKMSAVSGALDDTDGTKKYAVTVVADGYLINVGGPVDTEMGTARINAIYRAHGDNVVRVSIRFTEQQLEDNSDFYNQEE